MILLVVAVLFAAVLVAAAVLALRAGVDGVDPAPLESGEPRAAVREVMERRSRP